METANDILKKRIPILGYRSNTGDADYSRDECVIAMIEFAKLHVKAAIKECIESAPSGSSTDTVSYEDVVECLRDCYPESNII